MVARSAPGTATVSSATRDDCCNSASMELSRREVLAGAAAATVAAAVPVVPEPVEYMIVSAPRLARGAFLFDELSALEVWITGMPANDPKRAIKSGARF